MKHLQCIMGEKLDLFEISTDYNSKVLLLLSAGWNTHAEGFESVEQHFSALCQGFLLQNVNEQFSGFKQHSHKVGLA